MTPHFREAKYVLMKYRRLARLTGCLYSLGELHQVTQQSLSGNAISSQDESESYLNHQIAIITAWQSLPKKEREVLYYSYFCMEPMKMVEIAAKMNYSLKSIERYKSLGCKNFIREFKKVLATEVSRKFG